MFSPGIVILWMSRLSLAPFFDLWLGSIDSAKCLLHSLILTHRTRVSLLLYLARERGEAMLCFLCFASVATQHEVTSAWRPLHSFSDLNFVVQDTFAFVVPLAAMHMLLWPLCNEMRGVNYRQVVSEAMHEDLIPVRWNDVRWGQLSSHRGVWQKSELN